MAEILDLVDYESEDPELVPEILPIDARLSIRGRTEDFRSIFERAVAITPVKEQIPGTSMLHISVRDNGIVRIVATDGEKTAVIDTGKFKVQREGSALLPAHKFGSILGLAPDEFLTLTVLSNSAQVTSGRAVWNVTTPAGERLAPVQDIGEVTFTEIPRKPFLQALNTVRSSLAGRGSRLSLMQARIEDGAITTTNGFRMTRQRLEGMPKNVLASIPSAAFEDITRLLRSSSEPAIKIGTDKQHVVLKVGTELIVASKMMFEFPNVDALLLAPAIANKTEVSLNTNELTDIIKRVRVSADPEYTSVSLSFEKDKTGNTQLTVSARDRNGNSAYERMVAIVQGDLAKFDVVVDHKYLLDLLAASPQRIGTFRVGADTKTKLAPLLLEDTESGFLGVIAQSTYRS